MVKQNLKMFVTKRTGRMSLQHKGRLLRPSEVIIPSGQLLCKMIVSGDYYQESSSYRYIQNIIIRLYSKLICRLNEDYNVQKYPRQFSQ